MTVNKCECGAESEISLSLTKADVDIQPDDETHYCLDCYEDKCEADKLLDFPMDMDDGWDDE